MSDTPHRTVVIVRDAGSPLHAIRCAKPCDGGTEYCMGHDLGQRMCWLGSALTEAGAVKLAESIGYTVITSPDSPASSGSR